MSVKEIKAEELRQKGFDGVGTCGRRNRAGRGQFARVDDVKNNMNETAGYVKYMLAVLHEKTKKGVKTNAESRDERCYV